MYDDDTYHTAIYCQTLVNLDRVDPTPAANLERTLANKIKRELSEDISTNDLLRYVADEKTTSHSAYAITPMPAKEKLRLGGALAQNDNGEALQNMAKQLYAALTAQDTFVRQLVDQFAECIEHDGTIYLPWEAEEQYRKDYLNALNDFVGHEQIMDSISTIEQSALNAAMFVLGTQKKHRAISYTIDEFDYAMQETLKANPPPSQTLAKKLKKQMEKSGHTSKEIEDVFDYYEGVFRNLAYHTISDDDREAAAKIILDTEGLEPQLDAYFELSDCEVKFTTELVESHGNSNQKVDFKKHFRQGLLESHGNSNYHVGNKPQFAANRNDCLPEVRRDLEQAYIKHGIADGVNAAREQVRTIESNIRNTIDMMLGSQPVRA